MNIFFSFLFLTSLLILSSCNQKGDRDELRSKSMARADIIQRSGTTIIDEKEALIDAKNRLRTGGGLFGKKGTEISTLFSSESNRAASIGMPVNPYLWKGALDTIEFMPIASADPFGGLIITDWYSTNSKNGERCKLNIFIKGSELKTNNLKVNSFCQKINSENLWLDTPTSKEDDIKLENAILNKAKKIKLGSS